MVYNVYSMRDALTGFMTPTIAQSDAVAVRFFTHAVVNSQDILSSHVQHFSLYRIGSFDTDKGTLNHIEPELVIDGPSAFRAFSNPS